MPTACPQRRYEEEDAVHYRALPDTLLGTIKHYFRSIPELFEPVTDPRNPHQIHYPLAELLFTGGLMFLCRLRARRQIQ